MKVDSKSFKIYNHGLIIPAHSPNFVISNIVQVDTCIGDVFHFSLKTFFARSHKYMADQLHTRRDLSDLRISIARDVFYAPP